MCGGSNTTTQQVTIPPEVLQRYQAVNTRAEQTAAQPFQQYSTDPNAFVAPLNSTQQAGIANTNAVAGSAQPYYQAATTRFLNSNDIAQPYLQSAEGDIASGLGVGSAYAGAAQSKLQHGQQAANGIQGTAQANIAGGLAAAQPFNAGAGALYGAGLAGAQPFNQAANQNISQAQSGAQPYQDLATRYGLAGAQAVDPSTLGAANINQYMSPYLSTVLGSTAALLNQQNQQQQSGQLGDAIRSGAFGGDRAGIAAANLAQQQQLANANVFSGILNTGYGQALNTAQQQQGLNLSAGQANRSALASAAPELAAIGQQGFGQGITAAQAQAGLGQQIFGQGLAGGSAIQGLGQQVYGQNTGTGQAQAQLGQQYFGQGLAASQQEAALGQQQYQQAMQAAQAQSGLGAQQFGMASTVGQNLQGLGNQVQTSGLQGAQAQLGAGQVAQQTQQAGQTALYNQFLQQQSYPFQVSQFLANIAEGTGALSGSTTTTQTPAGIFSDERLKQDAKVIGKTFDGQPIYSFKYKGHPTTMIGLMAQDVEHKHPGAVGLAGGYKTVDYGKATQGAAERGHFAAGGLARAGYAYGGYPMALPGMSPYDIEALLQSQGAGPYASAGLYGGGLGGAPRGGGSYVPAANLPVGHLAVAGDAPKAASGMDQVRNVAQTGEALGESASKLGDIWRKWHPKSPSDDSTDDGEPPFARGGLAGYADGGDVLPYDDQKTGPSLDIPDDKPDVHSLQTPGSSGSKDPNNAGQAASAAKAALDVAKIAAMFLKRGGRVGFADGGSPDDDANNTDQTVAALLRGTRAVESGSPKGDYSAKGPLTKTGDRGFGAYQVMGANIPSWTKEITGQEMTPEEFLASPEAQDRIARAKMSQNLTKYGNVDDAAATWFTGRPLASAGNSRDMLGTTTPDYIQKVKANMGLAAAGPPPAPIAPPPEPANQNAGLAGGVGSDPLPMAAPANDSAPPPAHSEERRGLLARLGGADTLIPLLAGLGAMGSAPTNNFGTALAAGLAGGASAWQGQRQFELEKGLRQGHLGVEQQRAQADVLQKTMGVAGSRFVPIGTNPDGSHIWRDSVVGDQINDSERLRRIMSMGGMKPLLPSAGTAPGAAASAQAPTGAGTAAKAPTAEPAAAPAQVQAAPAAKAKTDPPASPSPSAASIYAAHDSDPRVKSLYDQATQLQAQAEGFTRQANDPLVIGTTVAQQSLEKANNARAQAQQLLGQWQTLREQLAAPEIATLTEAQKTTFQVQNGAKTQAFDQARQAQDTLNQARAIRSQMIDPKTGKPRVSGGPAAPIISKIGALAMQTSLVSPELVEAITHTDPNNAEAVRKLQTAMGTEIARQELQGSPVRQSEWMQFQRSTPGLDMPTAASLFILDHIISPRAKGAVDLYDKVKDMNPLQKDIRNEVFTYWQDNPWYKPGSGVEAEGPIQKDAHGVYQPKTPADLAGLPPGTAFIVPEGPMKGKIGHTR